MGRTPYKYHTYAQAKAKVQTLGIKNLREYREYTRKPGSDGLLPTDPVRVYGDEWEGWPTFCGKSQYAAKYATYEQASAAAQKLNIASKQEYQKRYVEDSALPIAPERVYAESWSSWTRFLGGADPFNTLAEASVAAQRLKIRTSREYDDRYKENPRLPAAPDRMYEDWTGWDSFLGK